MKLTFLDLHKSNDDENISHKHNDYVHAFFITCILKIYLNLLYDKVILIKKTLCNINNFIPITFIVIYLYISMPHKMLL